LVRSYFRDGNISVLSFGIVSTRPRHSDWRNPDNRSNLLSNNIWTHVKGADGMEVAINPINANIMFCTQQFGGVHRSTDGGNSWSFIFDGDGEDDGWVTPYLSVGTSKIFAGYQNVWKSQNNGNSFIPISSFGSSASIRDLAVAKSNDDIIYVTFSVSLHKTEDGGASWQNISNNLPNLSVTDIQIHPTHPNIAWVTTSGYDNGDKVYVTTNGGTTWQNISQNLPNIPANAIVYQEGTNGGLYVGMDVGVYYTDSTLSNWQAFDLGMPNVIVNELEIQYGVSLIRAATYGRGIWESELFTPSTLPPEADFTNSTGEVCPLDSISFTDASTNASPGWTWYFPGGSPSTSTMSNPSVLYTSAGIYEVSLLVENANGTDSIAQLVEVTFGDINLDLAIQTDQYPSETTWEILDDVGNVVSSVGGYAYPSTLHEQSICLAFGCYEFVIYDSFGDGICCDYGNGSYELTDNVNLSIQGGSFGASESYNFCFEEEEDASLSKSVLSDFEMYPNPTSDQITILPQQEGKYSITIYDATGRTIIQKEAIQGEHKINVDHFASGVYQVKWKVAL
jgi:PKD repeat protein